MKLSYILGIFSVICFLAAMIFSGDVSKTQSQQLTGDGGLFGPFIVKEKNSNYIEVNVLDKNKNYLFGFGDSMWHESGYDDEGRWEESKTKYSMDITFKDAGEYYFEVKSERNDGQGNAILLNIVKERGSNVPFITLGVISLLAALLAHYVGGTIKDNKKSKKTQYIGIAAVLVILFIVAISYSTRGWGYMGYNGYYHGPSFFYMGGPSVYHQPSNRDGSVSGSGNRGGGFSGGK